MKALFITYSRAYNEEILELLDSFGQRGFTRWTDIGGRGSSDGLPHMGSHAWPDMNHAVISVVDDGRVDDILKALRALDTRSPELGLRAFVWNVEKYF